MHKQKQYLLSTKTPTDKFKSLMHVMSYEKYTNTLSQSHINRKSYAVLVDSVQIFG